MALYQETLSSASSRLLDLLVTPRMTDLACFGVVLKMQEPNDVEKEGSRKRKTPVRDRSSLGVGNTKRINPPGAQIGAPGDVHRFVSALPFSSFSIRSISKKRPSKTNVHPCFLLPRLAASPAQTRTPSGRRIVLDKGCYLPSCYGLRKHEARTRYFRDSER